MNKTIFWQKVFVIGEVYGIVDIREGGNAKEPEDEGNASKQIGPSCGKGARASSEYAPPGGLPDTTGLPHRAVLR